MPSFCPFKIRLLKAIILIAGVWLDYTSERHAGRTRHVCEALITSFKSYWVNMQTMREKAHTFYPIAPIYRDQAKSSGNPCRSPQPKQPFLLTIR